MLDGNGVDTLPHHSFWMFYVLFLMGGFWAPWIFYLLMLHLYPRVNYLWKLMFGL